MNTCQVAIQLLILTSHFIYLQTANGAPSPSVDLPFISLEIANGAASTPPLTSPPSTSDSTCQEEVVEETTPQVK